MATLVTQLNPVDMMATKSHAVPMNNTKESPWAKARNKPLLLNNTAPGAQPTGPGTLVIKQQVSKVCTVHRPACIIIKEQGGGLAARISSIIARRTEHLVWHAKCTT